MRDEAWKQELEKEERKRAAQREKLLNNIKQRLPELQELLKEINHEGIYEQAVYRYYYQSFKIFGYQEYTEKIMQLLEELSPEDVELQPYFVRGINTGLNRKFTIDKNERWEEEALPILNAFLHTRYMLEMMVKYGEGLDNPEHLPYGWATIRILYGLR